MLPRTVPRLFWMCWILLFCPLIWGIECASAQSCHEVKTAFQLRQVGSLKWVPETAATDADLSICKHQGPTCCTRKMEVSYYAAAQRDTLQNILSYSFELKFLILGHVSSFQDSFHSLLSFTLNHTYSLFDSAYEPISQDARPIVSTLFFELGAYLRGSANISVERSVNSFFDKLFPLVYQHLVNPGLGSPVSIWSFDGSECLRATRHDVNPFGSHPQDLFQELFRALAAGRALSRALAVGGELLNATEMVGLARQCGHALVRMQFCPHCRGLTLIRPCRGLCLNVMRGCLADLAELDGPWRRYVALLEGLSGALAGGNELELALLRIRERINDAILTAQLKGPHLSAVVGKVCGSLTEPVSSTPVISTSRSLDLTVNSTIEPQTSVSSSSPTTLPDTGNQLKLITLKRRSLPLKPSRNDKPRNLKKISKEFTGYIQRYKSFFSTLPEMLCEGEVVMEEHTCWSGEDVVESYTGHVVGNGLQAQRHNPEIKFKSPDPVLVTVKERLEHFNQELWGEAGLATDGHEEADTGSGDAAEGSGDCDDEDGCQGSGHSKGETVNIEKKIRLHIPPWGTNTPIKPRPKPGVNVKGAAHTPTISPILVLLLLSLIHHLLLSDTI
ncbi:glypican-5-like isoform X1 [Xyrauchen texanus]|uniref:glypican-5-like isoform X1 n=1 Tax=Xyrauchen texanus TaxID=154827 RepID=UPI002242179A|nr:glypican-5-like isoform X1 [Xyrauchen texanus]